MQDLLHRLYRLTLHKKRLDREDFVSMCLGRHLETDLDLLRHIVKAMTPVLSGDDAQPLKAWLARSDQSVEVRAQVLARTSEEPCPGWADLIVTLRSGGEPARIVIEAKVDTGVPSSKQLDRYRRAFDDATVVALVEQARVEAVDGPAISWDDVLRGIRDTPHRPHLAAARQDLNKLLMAAELGDPRLALSPKDYTVARGFEDTFHRLDDRIRACLVELGPNPTLRATIKNKLKKERFVVEPDDGWGTGFESKRALPNTRVRGLTLGVRASSFADELVWQLEVRVVGKRLPKWLNSKDSEWRRVAGYKSWFVTELLRTRGTGHLTIQHFRDLIEAGRGALRRLHTHSRAGDWHARGHGDAPHAPHLSIPDLRDGLLVWEPVANSIDRIVTDTLSAVCAPFDEKGRTRPFRRSDAGWTSFRGVLPNGIRLSGDRVDGIEAITFTLQPTPPGAPEALEQALASWPQDLTRPTPTSGDTIRLALDGPTLFRPGLVEVLARLLRTTIEPR